VITGINCGIGDTIAVGQVILSVEPATAAAAPAPVESAPAAPVAEKPAEAVQEPVAPVAPVQPVAPVPPVAPVVSKPESALVKKAAGEKVMVAAGPAIRRFAREVGVDLQTIQGSGEHGRIVREDVLKVVREGSRQGGGQSSDPAGSQSDGYGPVHIEKMPKIRQTIAKKMHESWTTCPRVTNFDDADVTALEEIRQNSKQEYAAGGIKLTSMPFLVKAVAMALKSHPVINASVDLEQGQIIYKDYVNVGIAIDTERGLVVPSLRNADNLGIPDVARQLGQLAENVRSGNFSIDDLRGGTFTISNLGAIGGTYSTPIINTPETAILLVGRSRKLPVVVGDEVKIRLMMPLSLSYDHRLIDGGAAARFLNEVIGYLEAPSRLLLAL
jgi:pyruvate/2-oxoglutarate dehydrogenase complex dihydrolipoamide acyltransferase (E2) component